MNDTLNNIKMADSLAAKSGPAGGIQDILDWLIERNRQVRVSVDLVNFDQLKDWRFNPSTGDLEHISGKFFAIRGVDIHADGFRQSPRPRLAAGDHPRRRHRADSPRIPGRRESAVEKAPADHGIPDWQRQ